MNEIWYFEKGRIQNLASTTIICIKVMKIYINSGGEKELNERHFFRYKVVFLSVLGFDFKCTLFENWILSQGIQL